MSKLIILDGDNRPTLEKEDGVVVLWSGFSKEKNEVSIPDLVDAQGEVLRREYLVYVYKLGNFRYKEKTVREHLAIGEDFSYWWMTLLQEKSLYKSPAIFELLKFRVLEKLYLSRQCDGIVLYSKDIKLHRLMRRFSKNLSCSYVWKSQGVLGNKSSFKSQLKQALPYPIRAILFYVRFIVKKRSLIFKRFAFNYLKRFDAQNGIILVTYFPNIDMELAEKGIFYSHYWRDLHKLLEQQKMPVTWILLFNPSSQCTLKEAFRLRIKFEKHYRGKQHFIFLHEFLSIRHLLSGFLQYLKLFLISFRLTKALSKLKYSDSNLPISDILRLDWLNSLRGSVAMEACLWEENFQGMFASLKRQRLGFYLMENQAWEKVLSYHWGKSNFGKLMGIVHSSVRFFDFRYYDAPALWQEVSSTPFRAPLPNKIVVNGELAQRNLCSSGVPADRVILAEALRYLYLGDFEKKERSSHASPIKTILCLTDYKLSASRAQIALLAQALSHEKNKNLYKVLVKSHPYFSVSELAQEELKGLSVGLVTDHLSELWNLADIIFVSNMTTAVLEALNLGLPCIVAQDPSSVNFSPARGMEEVSFVSMANDLIVAIKNAKPREGSRVYFCLDGQLPRWQNLLEVA